jgi:hypothetical protein
VSIGRGRADTVSAGIRPGDVFIPITEVIDLRPGGGDGQAPVVSPFQLKVFATAREVFLRGSSGLYNL